MLSKAALMLLLAVPAAGEGSSVTSQMSQMMDMAHKAMTPKPVQKCAGPTCCARSTCYKGPGLSCDSARGKTKCIGARLFPPTKGMCSCEAGACGSDGKCPDAPQATFPGTQSPATAPASAPSGWSRLFAKPTGPVEHVPPEDFTLAFSMLGVAGLALSVTGVALGLRLRRRRSQTPYQSESLVEAFADTWADHEDGIRGQGDEGLCIE